jgi:hypothetical protein
MTTSIIAPIKQNGTARLFDLHRQSLQAEALLIS